ncbi:unnamed protein product [Victoria cruziana]
MVGLSRITSLENGELGRPILTRLFLQESVYPYFFSLVSNGGVDNVGFCSSWKPASLRNLMRLPVWLSIEESNEYAQRSGSLNAEKGVGLREGEEKQRVGCDGWGSLNSAVRLWAEEVFAMASRTLKHQYIISQGKNDLSERAKKHAECRGWRGFERGYDVDFLGAELLMKLASQENFRKLKGFISNGINGLAERVSSVPINMQDFYQKINRCRFEDDFDGRMLPPILDLLPYAFRCTPFFVKGRSGDDSGNKERLSFDASTDSSSNKRRWTNILLINSLIDRGEIWRLGTSSLLHANIGHLMVNCVSLNSVGPLVERICGHSRFLGVYVASAFASSATSYIFCRSPAVGASGAIFGLVGSYAMFILRHRAFFKDGKQDLFHIVRVIALNMAVGVLSKGIDNWGHLGGLLGGAAVSWLVGPAWTYQYTRSHGKQVLVDKPPLHYFLKL